MRTCLSLKGFIRPWEVEPLEEFNTTSQSSLRLLGPLFGPGFEFGLGGAGGTAISPSFRGITDQALKIAQLGELDVTKD